MPCEAHPTSRRCDPGPFTPAPWYVCRLLASAPMCEVDGRTPVLFTQHTIQEVLVDLALGPDHRPDTRKRVIKKGPS